MTSSRALGEKVIELAPSFIAALPEVARAAATAYCQGTLLRNEIEARESFIDLQDAPGWQTVICPSSWHVSGTQDIGLGYLIQPGTKGAALRSHSPVKIWAPRAIAAAVVLGGGLGGYLYWQNIQEQEHLAEAARLQAEEIARLEVLIATLKPLIGEPVLSLDQLRLLRRGPSGKGI